MTTPKETNKSKEKELTPGNAIQLGLAATQEHALPGLMRIIKTLPEAVLATFLADQFTLNLSEQILKEVPTQLSLTTEGSLANHALSNLTEVAKLTIDQVSFQLIPDGETGISKADLATLLTYFATYANSVRFRQQTIEQHPHILMRIFAAFHNAVHERSSNKSFLDKIWNFCSTSLETLNIGLVHMLPYTANLATSLSETLPYTELNGSTVALIGLLPATALMLDVAVVFASVAQYGYLSDAPLPAESLDAALPQDTPQLPAPIQTNPIQKLTKAIATAFLPRSNPANQIEPSPVPKRLEDIRPKKVTTDSSGKNFKPLSAADINRLPAPSQEKGLTKNNPKRLPPPQKQ